MFFCRAKQAVLGGGKGAAAAALRAAVAHRRLEEHLASAQAAERDGKSQTGLTHGKGGRPSRCRLEAGPTSLATGGRNINDSTCRSCVERAPSVCRRCCVGTGPHRLQRLLPACERRRGTQPLVRSSRLGVRRHARQGMGRCPLRQRAACAYAGGAGHLRANSAAHAQEWGSTTQHSSACCFGQACVKGTQWGRQ